MQKQIEYDCPYTKDIILIRIMLYSIVHCYCMQLLFVTKLDIDILKITLKFCIVIEMNH